MFLFGCGCFVVLCGGGARMGLFWVFLLVMVFYNMLILISL